MGENHEAIMVIECLSNVSAEKEFLNASPIGRRSAEIPLPAINIVM